MASRTRNYPKRASRAAAAQHVVSADSNENVEEPAKESNEINYDVEKVVGKRYDEEGNLFYCLKWKGWEGEPTWEPEEYCLCEKLIEDYEKVISKKREKQANKQIRTPQRKQPIVKKKSIEKPVTTTRRLTRRAIYNV